MPLPAQPSAQRRAGTVGDDQIRTADGRPRIQQQSIHSTTRIMPHVNDFHAQKHFRTIVRGDLANPVIELSAWHGTAGRGE
jgi:hypothetical protein